MERALCLRFSTEFPKKTGSLNLDNREITNTHVIEAIA